MKSIFPFIIISCAAIVSCTEKEYLIEEPESPELNSPPAYFEIQVRKITDHEVSFSWNIPVDPENDEVKFDICVNDSVIYYDYQGDMFSIENLKSDTEYRLSVLALDKYRSSSTASKLIHTQKSFIEDIIDLRQEYENVIIHSVLKLNEDGFLILARGRVSAMGITEYEYFALKLNTSYFVEWKKKYNWEGKAGMAPIKLNRCADGGILVAQFGAVTKLNSLGDVEWTYRVNDAYNLSFFKSVIQIAFGEYIAIGYTNSGKYIIIRLNVSGEEVWSRIYDNPNKLFPEEIRLRDGNQFMIWGSYDSGQYFVYMDSDGNITGEKFFNQPGGFVFCSETNAKDYLFFGMNDAYSVRIAKVDQAGNLIWNIYPELKTPAGYSGYVSASDKISDSEYLVLAVDDRGVSLSTLDIDRGQVTGIIKLGGYPNGFFVRYNDSGYYEYISESGYLFKFNIDGYREE